ncbi:MAG: hypothetical protein Q8L07_09770 [Sediminibacterium sp.]|nr:hypothetical protein [Sediminibacterium sp.]
MKKYLIFLLLGFIFVSCQKNESITEKSSTTENSSLLKAQTYLQSTMPGNDFEKIKWETVRNGKIGKEGFVILVDVTSKSGEIKSIVVVNDNNSWSANYFKTHIKINEDRSATGFITIESIDGTTIRTVDFVRNKYVGAPLNGNVSVNSSGEIKGINSDNTDLPPVTVTGYRPAPYNDFVFLNSLYWITLNTNHYPIFIDGTTSSDPAYYVSMSVAYQFEPDDSEARLEKALAKLLACFGAISNSGATYTVALNADVPLNSRPSTVIQGISGGHAFLTLTKTNGSNSVTQVFGFYPKYMTKAASLSDVTSAIKDDSGHEINASISLDVSASNFSDLMTYISNHSSNDYNLTGYNCTDFALEAFNTMLSTPISVNQSAFNSGHTPSGLYLALNNLKAANGALANNIFLDLDTAPTGHGECN